MPYRGRKEERVVTPAREGLVADMVRQFADPHAFVRELVQNGIDAGASELEVGVALRDGMARCWVRDDGSGMAREVIEGPLLTLFTSAKDGDDTKIGKYGVGFVSVFAIEPERVQVDTWTGEEAWELTLFPDHRYELRKSPPTHRPSPSGTMVSVLRPTDGEGFEELVSALHASLLRWCRHAAVPLHWRVERGDHRISERADRPFEVVSPLSVTSEAEGARYVVGIAGGARYLDESDEEFPFSGFYNRGLTLHERYDVIEPELDGVRFKVDSPALSHTLSRDDVRHDDAFHLALRHVRDLVRGPLRHRLIQAIQQAAREADGLRYASLLAAAGPTGLRLVAGEIEVPLCNIVDGRRTRTLYELRGKDPILWAGASGALTEAMARRSEPVLLARHADVVSILEPRVEEGLLPLSRARLLLEAVDKPLAGERKLMPALEKVLEELGVGPVPQLVKARGGDILRAAYGAHDERRRHVMSVNAPRWGLWYRTAPHLLLVRNHRAVRRAAKLARKDALGAALLLARYLLVEDRGELDRRTRDGLMTLSVRRTDG